jgi:electron transport complex protein RnfG
MGKNTIVKDAIILLLITCIAGAILGGIYQMTKPSIDNVEAEATAKAYAAVYPNGELEQDNADLLKALETFKPDDSDASVDDVYSVNNGEGFVFTCSAKGYGGDVSLALGVKKDGTITGMNVISAANETPGLGAKCKDSEFTDQFTDLAVNGQVTINEDYDQISGATITSKAVMRAVNAALKFASENQ